MLRKLKLVCTVALSLKQIVCVCSLSIVFNSCLYKAAKHDFFTTLPSQGDKENVVTHWTMDPHQSKMCLAHSVNNSLIPGKLFFHVHCISYTTLLMCHL